MAKAITDRFSALYFPYINIRDRNWLKLSLLLWNSVYRIVPYGYPKERSYDFIRDINEKSDIIHSINPEGYAQLIEDAFIDFIESNLRDLDRFRLDSSLIRNINSHRQTRHRFSEGELGAHIPGISFIYSEKMGHRLQEILLNNDLGLLASDDDYGYMRWIGVDRKIAALYMTVLANSISSDQRLNPITDSGPHLAAIDGNFEAAAKILLSSEPAVDTRLARSNVYDEAVLLSIQRHIPQDITKISFEEIIAFRQKRAKELRQFREYVGTKIRDFETGKDGMSPAVLSDWMKEEIFADLDEKVAEIDEFYRDFGQELIPNVLSIKVTAPAIATTIISQAIHTPALSAAGFAVSLIPTLLTARKNVRQATQDNPAAFLYKLRGLGNLNQANAVKQLGYKSRNFIFGE